MTNQPTNQQVNDPDTFDQDSDNTPIDGSQRHTGVHEESDGEKQEIQPESSFNTGPEGAPNQGTEKR